MIFILTFLTSAVLTWYLSRLSHLDKPNARSLHTTPTPTSGGLAILIALIIPTLYLEVHLNGLIIGLLLIALISFIDDHRHVPALFRLIVHFIAAYLLLNDFLLLSVFAFLFVVWMINLYNFMDGMDGFAGGMAVIGFSTLAVLGAEHHLFMTMNLLIATAAGGFLIFNFPPAKIFMGDVGSSSLGYLAAGFSLWGSHENLFPLWIAILVFSPFIVDATVTLLRRLFRREKVWQAHKSHYYQRLVELGWGHKRTVLWEYVLMIACSVSALIAPFLPVWVLLVGWGLIYLGLIFFLVPTLERQCH